MDVVAEFWSVFLKEKDELSSQSPSSDSMDALLASLSKINAGLYFHVGLKDDSADLIVSAEGDPDLMSVIARIVDEAPVVKNWGFLSVFDGLALFGERNDSLYPDTSSGDALYRMVQNGDRPWVLRPIDFNVVFPSLDSANQFCVLIGQEGIEAKASAYDGAEGYTHEVHISREMTATLSSIESFEAYLEKSASGFGGKNDGWGCHSV